MLDLPGKYTKRCLNNEFLIGNRIEMSYLSDVYFAKDLEQRSVAVKVSHPLGADALRDTQQTLERVMRLSHPDLLIPHRAFVLEEDDEHRLVEVTEYLPERHWSTLDRARHRISFQDSLRAVRHATAGLAEIHRAGLVHRDARMTNIFVDTHTMKAKLFDYNTTSPPYVLEHGEPDARNVAPEFRTGGCIGYAFDVWLLGNDLASLAKDITKREQPWRPEATPLLIDIISCTTAERSEDRYRDAGELLRALDSL